MPRRELLRHDWTFGSIRPMLFWTVFVGFGSDLHKLPHGPLSSIYRHIKLQQLSDRHLS